MLIVIPPSQVPGIGTAAVYAANEQMGTILTFDVPTQGNILEVRFHDVDDEGINKEVWFFDYPPALANDNAAFSLGDTDNLKVVAVFVFDVWRDAVNNQLGLTTNTPASYIAPDKKLYAAVKTLGADNIAAGSEPWISLVIEEVEP